MCVSSLWICCYSSKSYVVDFLPQYSPWNIFMIAYYSLYGFCWILVHQFSWFCTLILSLLPKVFQKLFLMSLDTFFLTFWGFSCRWRTTESKILQNFTIFTLTLRWWTDSCHLQHRDWLVSMAAKVVKTVYDFTVVAFALSALSITSLRLRLWG